MPSCVEFAAASWGSEARDSLSMKRGQVSRDALYLFNGQDCQIVARGVKREGLCVCVCVCVCVFHAGVAVGSAFAGVLFTFHSFLSHQLSSGGNELLLRTLRAP